MCDIHSENATKEYSAHHFKRDKFMDFGLFKTIVDQAAEFIKIYIPQGAGEPLLHPKFPDMMDYIRQKSPEANIWFNTNGLLLKPELTDRLLASGIDLISFSIDAATADIYQRIRIGGDYDCLLHNIHYLLKARKRKRSLLKTKVGVSFVIQDLNRSQKKAFLRHWLPKVDQVVFYTKAEIDRSRPKMFFQPKCSRTPCESLWKSIAVAVDGTVVPCCGDVRAEEPLGNVKVNSLSEIVGKGRHLELRQMHLNGDFSGSRLCASCKTWMAYEKFTCHIPSTGIRLTRNPLSEYWELSKKRTCFFQ